MMLTAALLLTIALTTVEGRVTAGDAPLPGATVTLTSQSSSRKVVADAEGRYRFAGVPADEYELTFELAGMESVRRRVTAGAEPLVLPDADLPLTNASETLTFSCTLGAVCSDFEPRSRSDLPTCADYELDSALIEAAANGDGSAVRIIEQRYAAADTFRQRLRLAGALLRRTANDAAIWKELIELAEVAVDFPDAGHDPDDEEFLQWCAARSLDPFEHWSMALEALRTASADPRSQPLLLRILNEDLVLRGVAIEGLAAQRDFSALPMIDRSLSRAGEEGRQAASSLAFFADERADAVAKRYLADGEWERYVEYRAAE